MDNPTISEALRTGSLSGCQDELLRHLEVAVQDVFTTMTASICKVIGTSTAVETPTKPTEPTVSVPETGSTHDIAIEAVVNFSGSASGAVLLRCTHAGASDIARGLLMLDAGDEVAIADVRDALGECANMVTGALKTRALDPHGNFRLSVPNIDTHVNMALPSRAGRLVFQLAQGCAAIEIWLEENSNEPVH